MIDSIYLSRRSESFQINIPYCHQNFPVFDLFTDYLTPIRQEGYCIPVYWTHFSIISALRRENLDKDSSWNIRMFQCLTVKNNFNRVNYIILIIFLILTYSMKTEWHSYQNIGHVIQLNLSTQVVIQWNWRIVTHRYVYLLIRSDLGQTQVKYYFGPPTYLSYGLPCLLVHHCSIIGFEFLTTKIYVSGIVCWLRNPD